jgi:ABC-2 type transport system permease protein
MFDRWGKPSGKPGQLRIPGLPFLLQEYLRIMRGRLAALIWAMMIYAVVVLPFIMSKPPPEIILAIGTWLGAGATPSKVVLFLWVDASMNKFLAVAGPVLGGGIILDERSRGTLDLLASKPISGAGYFTVKLVAAWGAMATFYLGGAAGALLTFPWRVDEFDPSAFLALSAVHLFAALFAVAFSAAIAAWLQRRLAGMLASLTILSMLVGLAFLGFYNPAYRRVSLFNPISWGIVLIGQLEEFGVWDIGRPIAALLLFNAVAAWAGRWRASAVLEDRLGSLGTPCEPNRDAGQPIGTGDRLRSTHAGIRLASALAPRSGGELSPRLQDRSPRSPAEQGVATRLRARPRRPAAFLALLRLEAGRWSGRRLLTVLALISAIGILDALWLPSFPESVFRFFHRVLHLSDWAEIVLANNLTGLAFLLAWIGAFEMLRILVVPREERFLDVLLSKPMPRRDYVSAMFLPALGRVAVLGAIASVVHRAAMEVVGLAYNLNAYIGAVAVATGWALLMAALIHLLVIHARDCGSAILTAAVPILISMFPSMTYIYRPDIFGEPSLFRDLLLFPVNLVWHQEFAARWGLAVAASLALAAYFLGTLAGTIIERREFP